MEDWAELIERCLVQCDQRIVCRTESNKNTFACRGSQGGGLDCQGIVGLIPDEMTPVQYDNILILLIKQLLCIGLYIIRGCYNYFENLILNIKTNIK